MQTGTIRQLSRYHDFGFIRSDTGFDVLFHQTDVRGVTFALLKEGQGVRFNIGLSPKGFHAYNVELVTKGG